MNQNAPIRIGIDLGGTKISGIALDKDGSVLWHKRENTPKGSYEQTVETIGKVVDTIEADLLAQGLIDENQVGHSSVGIGTPGSASKRTGRMKNCNSTWLNDQPLQADIETRVKRPIRMANDADCLALSESVDGAGADADIVFAVIVGTGCGGGLVINKKPVSGPNSITGEWGHNPMPKAVTDRFGDRPCYCGKINCIETYANGAGLIKTGETLFNETIDPKLINERIEAGDTQARELIETYAHQFAHAISFVINIIDPDVVVLGGGLSNLGYLYEQLPHHLEPLVFSDTLYNRFAPAKYGDDSGVRGAAWLWNDVLDSTQ